MAYKLTTQNYKYTAFIYEEKITLKYLNIFSELGFRDLLFKKLNGKAFPKIILTLKFETNEENIITSAKVSWKFHEDEIFEDREIFFYNRDRSQGRINSHIDEAIDEYFNSLECNELITKLLTDVPRLKQIIDKVD
jgi:hypothetical protein